MSQNSTLSAEERRAQLRQQIAVSTPQRGLDEGRTAPAIDSSVGRINVNEIYPMGMGDIHIDDSLDFFRNPRDVQELSDEELEGLAQDSKNKGQLDPIWVRPCRRGWELIDGERRVNTAKLNRQTKILARIFNVSQLEAMEMAISLETHKKKWSAVAQGRAYISLQKLMQMKVEKVWALASPSARSARGNPKMTGENWRDFFSVLDKLMIENPKEYPTWLSGVFERAKNTGKEPSVVPEDMVSSTSASRRQIEDVMAVAGGTPELQDGVASGEITLEKARVIARVDDAEAQKRLTNEVKTKKLSVGETIARTRDLGARIAAKGKANFSKTGKAKFSSTEEEIAYRSAVISGDIEGQERKHDPIAVQSNIIQARSCIKASETALTKEGNEDPSWTREAKDALIKQLEIMEKESADLRAKLKRKGKFD